jgi:hypothetical protein
MKRSERGREWGGDKKEKVALMFPVSLKETGMFVQKI